MKRIVIKGEEITSREELHSVLKKELELPDHYGNNLDALWDCLTEGLEEDVFITWTDFEKSFRSIGPYALTTVRVIEDAANESGGKIVLKVE